MKLPQSKVSTAFLRVIGLIISLWACNVQAQNYLRVYKPGKAKSFKIKEGEIIRMKYKGHREKFKILTTDTAGVLLHSKEFGDIRMQASQLSRFWIQPDNFWNSATRGVTTKVPPFLLIFGIGGALNNDVFTNVFSPNFNGVQVMLGICVVAPIIYAIINWKKIDQKKWKVLVVDFRHLR